MKENTTLSMILDFLLNKFHGIDRIDENTKEYGKECVGTFLHLRTWEIVIAF